MTAISPARMTELHEYRRTHPLPVEMGVALDVFAGRFTYQVMQEHDDDSRPVEGRFHNYRSAQAAKAAAIKYVQRVHGKDTEYGKALVRMIRAL